jgi:hypothetical protein
MGNVDSTIYGGGTVYNDLVVVPIYDSNPGKVLLINPDTFTIVNTVTLIIGENNLKSVITAPGLDYAWICTAASPAKLIKIQLSTATRVGSLTLNSGENGCQSLSYKDGFVYVGIVVVTGTNNRLVKVNGDTMTRIGILGWGTINAGDADAQWIDGDFLYAVAETSTNNLAKINLTTFTVDTVDTSNGQQGITVFGDYVFTVANAVDQSVFRHRKSNLTYVDKLTFVDSLTLVRNVISGGNYIFVSEVNWGRLWKINPATFSVDSSIVPTETRGSANAAIAYANASTGNFLFISGITVAPIDVVKINADTMVEISILDSGIAGADFIEEITVR